MKYFLSMLIALILISCEREFDDRFDRPSYLTGNIGTVLQDRGDYSIFLKAAEMAGYKNMLYGRGFMTAFVPNDEAMKRFLEKKGVSSIEEYFQSEDGQLKGTQLVTYHLVKNSYNLSRLRNLFEGVPVYKLPTYCENELFNLYNNEDQHNRLIYLDSKWAPVFYKEIFDNNNVMDWTYNINKLFDQSYTTEINDREKVYYYSGAEITEAEIPADNGYIYFISEVAEPRDNILQHIKKTPELSHIYETLASFSIYIYNSKLSNLDRRAKGDSIFTIETYLGPASSYTISKESVGNNFGEAHSYFINTFFPYNQTLDDYISKVSNGTKDYNSLSLLSKRILITSLMDNSSMALPELVRDDKLKTFEEGTSLHIPIDQVDIKMCTNGFFYGMKQCPDINFLNCSFSKIFLDENYYSFMACLDLSRELPSILSSSSKGVTFIPNNEAMKDAFAIEKGYEEILIDDKIYGFNSKGESIAMSSSSVRGQVLHHFSNQEVDVETTMTKAYTTLEPFSIIYVQDGKIWAGGNETKISIDIDSEGEGYDGKSYTIEGLIKAPTKNFLKYLKDTPSCSEFLKLVKLIPEKLSPKGTLGDMFFIPTNEAIKTALANGQIPSNIYDIEREKFLDPRKRIILLSEDQNKLLNWLSQFIVKSDLSYKSQFIFPSDGTLHQFFTYSQEIDSETGNTNMRRITIDAQNHISIDLEGKRANVVTDIPTSIKDCALYRIDNTLTDLKL
ncbi:fasciclin domain-containing protein [Halosquirtibacter xylanolyticus]|uniref:fasciclin domain-containing protein n=1 Tax=Halosquirtibacter xylanolyticus TaxID=3374599 RepID=UPI003748829A|nr:fasciclin domain-containing protein [Prolixibacteraceae bacterium]